MISYALLDSDGYPTRLGTAATLPEGAVALPASADLEALSRMRRVDGEWAARPQPRVVIGEAAPSGRLIVLEDACGPGTIVRILDAELGDLLGAWPSPEPVSWVLADPGRYIVEIDPPRPWRPVSLPVEVAP